MLAVLSLHTFGWCRCGEVGVVVSLRNRHRPLHAWSWLQAGKAARRQSGLRQEKIVSFESVKGFNRRVYVESFLIVDMTLLLAKPSTTTTSSSSSSTSTPTSTSAIPTVTATPTSSLAATTTATNITTTSNTTTNTNIANTHTNTHTNTNTNATTSTCTTY